ncbi:hypothetical protein AAMO2058_001416200 [Amorphochlora amoebiformis]
MSPEPGVTHRMASQHSFATGMESGGVVNKRDSQPVRIRLYTARSQDGNERCADCSHGLLPKFASVTFGVFICSKCAHRHKSLEGDSMVIEVSDSAWTEVQVKRMCIGGNRRLDEYIRRSRVPRRSISRIENKYTHPTLKSYKVLLDSLASVGSRSNLAELTPNDNRLMASEMPESKAEDKKNIGIPKFYAGGDAVGTDRETEGPAVCILYSSLSRDWAACKKRIRKVLHLKEYWYLNIDADDVQNQEILNRLLQTSTSYHYPQIFILEDAQFWFIGGLERCEALARTKRLKCLLHHAHKTVGGRTIPIAQRLRSLPSLFKEDERDGSLRSLRILASSNGVSLSNMTSTLAFPDRAMSAPINIKSCAKFEINTPNPTTSNLPRRTTDEVVPIPRRSTDEVKDIDEFETSVHTSIRPPPRTATRLLHIPEYNFEDEMEIYTAPCDGADTTRSCRSSVAVTPRSVKPDPHVELNLRNQTKNETKSNPSRKGCHDDNAPSGHQNAQNAQNAQDASQNAQNACQNATDGRQNTQNASERAEKIST